MNAPLRRTFSGREIATEIVKAVEAIPAGHEIVTFKAGENMTIQCAFISEDDDGSYIPDHAWDGEKWLDDGYL